MRGQADGAMVVRGSDASAGDSAPEPAALGLPATPRT